MGRNRLCRKEAAVAPPHASRAAPAASRSPARPRLERGRRADAEAGARSCALRERKTRAIDIFRTTPPETVCPNFYVLAHANGCAFSPRCSYCYLKSSFWYLRGEVAFSNVDGMLRETARWIGKDDLESYVLNTGNLSDSLSFERARPLIAPLVDLFRSAEAHGRPHTLLLVTKGGTRECAALLGAAPSANVVVSFSVNSPEAARVHERGAAPVEERLRAARRLKAAGWRVRMRMDPMIQGFGYGAIARKVASLGPERVTLGTLRAEHNLERFAGDHIFEALAPAEAHAPLRRYPWDVRLALYREALDELRRSGRVSSFGLCEETPDMWRALSLDAEARSCNCGP